jgi:hypothetical protein
MRKKKVWRYYCEYCKKSNCNPASMKKHEAGCTNNPGRICGLCKITGEEQKPIGELITILGNGSDKELERLRAKTNNCPTCILAAIRQSGLQAGPDEDGSGFSVAFNYRAELADFWKEYNSAQNWKYEY